MMEITTMAERHLKALAEVERQCFHEPWSEAALREELGNEKNLFLVAEEQENILGYVGCQTVLDEGYITNVAVAPAARRRGIARALLQKLTEHAQARKLTFVTLEVRKSNAAAIALYAGQGYEQVGIRKGFYREPQEDAVLMTRYF
ncbi:MAG: ribosomal protein S18-alanine N-acetyltransferase [Butyricicoccus sp.]|nr:ribosomal protein S18-alanine N-acetyltransferase [Butyricicoccus sp.]